MYSIDAYSGLLASMHRTGLWKERYGAIEHPSLNAPLPPIAEIHEFIARNEAQQADDKQSFDEEQVRRNYRLIQIWDLLGLYFGCQEPVDDYMSPVPTREAGPDEGVKMTMTPLGDNRVAFDPYPFDVPNLNVQMTCRRLDQATFANDAEFRRAYFRAPVGLLEYELVKP
jgi:hypothetical protein